MPILILRWISPRKCYMNTEKMYTFEWPLFEQLTRTKIKVLVSDTGYSQTAEEENLEYKKGSSQPTPTSSMDNSKCLESNDQFSSRSVDGFLRKIDAIFTCEENGISLHVEKSCRAAKEKKSRKLDSERFDLWPSETQLQCPWKIVLWREPTILPIVGHAKRTHTNQNKL